MATDNTARGMAGSALGGVTSIREDGAEFYRNGRGNAPLPQSFTKWALSRRKIISAGGVGTWNQGGVGYGGDIVWDDETKQYAWILTGKKSDGSFGVGVYYSRDAATWTAYGSNPVFTASASSGDWDYGGVGIRSIYKDTAGTWHMFYAGFKSAGFEQPPSHIGHATAPSLTGPWTRDAANPIISGSSFTWIGSGATASMYSPELVEHNGGYYIFFNGGSAPGTESVGYAHASNINGPWTPVDVELITPTDVGGSGVAADPCIWKFRDTFYMMINNLNSGVYYLFYAHEDDFPGTWTNFGAVTTKGNQHPIRPRIVQVGSQIVMYSQVSTQVDLNIYVPASENDLRTTVDVYQERFNLACDIDYGGLAFTSTLGARKGAVMLNSGGSQMSLISASGSVGAETETTQLAWTTTSALVITKWGGATASFPAIKRNGTALETKLADDSDYTKHVAGTLAVVDGVTAPTAVVGQAILYVDTADGDLKVIFGDGTVKTLSADT